MTRINDGGEPLCTRGPQRINLKFGKECTSIQMEAEAANWRAGFYRIAFSPTEVVTKLGKPNVLEAEH
jgi:hypothetical protein